MNGITRNEVVIALWRPDRPIHIDDTDYVIIERSDEFYVEVRWRFDDGPRGKLMDVSTRVLDHDPFEFVAAHLDDVEDCDFTDERIR